MGETIGMKVDWRKGYGGEEEGRTSGWDKRRKRRRGRRGRSEKEAIGSRRWDGIVRETKAGITKRK